MNVKWVGEPDYLVVEVRVVHLVVGNVLPGGRPSTRLRCQSSGPQHTPQQLCPVRTWRSWWWQLWRNVPSLKVLVVTIMMEYLTFLPSHCPVVAVGQRGRRKPRRVLLSFCGFCIIWISTIVVLLLCLFVYLFDLNQAHHHCFCLFIF